MNKYQPMGSESHSSRCIRIVFAAVYAALLLVVSVGAWQNDDKKDARGEAGLLVEAAWLADHLTDPRIRVVDMRPEDEYSKGHIPGSVRFDSAKLRTTDKTLLYLPTSEDFAKAMGDLGVGTTTHVVIYDGTGGNFAARLWWALDYFGHREASLLNGSWPNWAAENRPISTAIPVIAKTQFVARGERPTVCTAEQLIGKVKSANVVVIDARSPEEYSGERLQAKRGGHVPGAVNIDWHRNLNSDLTFRPAAELREMYARAGVTEGKEVITYCQSGGRASHTLFALRLIGVTRAKNYYGSWADWGNRDDTPIEKEKTP